MPINAAFSLGQSLLWSWSVVCDGALETGFMGGGGTVDDDGHDGDGGGPAEDHGKQLMR